MDARLDEIMQAIENISRNLVLLETDVDSELLDDAGLTLLELETDDLQAIRLALEAGKS